VRQAIEAAWDEGKGVQRRQTREANETDRMQAREAGNNRHIVEGEGRSERVQIFFLETPCKTPKTNPPPAIHHHGRAALIMPWAGFTTARRALIPRGFE
jgi:hypothetical protein